MVTLLRMLTGDEVPSGGSATVLQHSLHSSRREFLSQVAVVAPPSSSTGRLLPAVRLHHPPTDGPRAAAADVPGEGGGAWGHRGGGGQVDGLPRWVRPTGDW